MRIARLALSTAATVAVLVGVGVAGDAALRCCTDANRSSDGEGPLNRPLNHHDCRAMCFRFAELRCGDVEEECGRNADIVVIDGLPFHCKEVERSACHLYHGSEDCLAGCEEIGAL